MDLNLTKLVGCDFVVIWLSWTLTLSEITNKPPEHWMPSHVHPSHIHLSCFYAHVLQHLLSSGHRWRRRRFEWRSTLRPFAGFQNLSKVKHKWKAILKTCSSAHLLQWSLVCTSHVFMSYQCQAWKLKLKAGLQGRSTWNVAPTAVLVTGALNLMVTLTFSACGFLLFPCVVFRSFELCFGISPLTCCCCAPCASPLVTVWYTFNWTPGGGHHLKRFAEQGTAQAE